MLPHEVSDSIFTTVLEKVMGNIGLRMPFDSDPNFYNDHYDQEVIKRDGRSIRQRFADENGKNATVTSASSKERLSTAELPNTLLKDESVDVGNPNGASELEAMELKQKLMKEKALSIKSGLSSAMTIS